MKIYSVPEIKQLITTLKNPAAGAVEKTAEKQQTDKIDFSEQLKRVQNMEKKFPPDTARQVRLQEIKEQISNGTYAPDSKKVAASLLKYILNGRDNG